MAKVTPKQPLEHVGTAGLLASWLRLDDDDDPVLEMMLLQATAGVRSYLQKELKPRVLVASYDRYPSTGIATSPNLSPSAHKVTNSFLLPYAALLSVERVVSYGDDLDEDDYTVSIDQDSVIVNPIYSTGNSEYPAISIEYTAGYEPVPKEIEYWVVAIAGYMYGKRGACDIKSAIVETGAADALQSYRNPSSIGVL